MKDKLLFTWHERPDKWNVTLGLTNHRSFNVQHIHEPMYWKMNKRSLLSNT